jgi:hypothetical protein
MDNKAVKKPVSKWAFRIIFGGKTSQPMRAWDSFKPWKNRSANERAGSFWSRKHFSQWERGIVLSRETRQPMSLQDRLGKKTFQLMRVRACFKPWPVSQWACRIVWAGKNLSQWERRIFLGMPRPSVTWWREGTIYDNSYEVSPSGLVVNKMKYLNLQVMMICKPNSTFLQYTTVTV